MGSRQLALFGVAGILLIAVLVVYFWGRSGPAEIDRAEMVKVLTGSGTDEERIKAAVALADSSQATTADLRQALEGQPPDAVRAAILAALGQRRDWQSVPLFLEAMNDPSEAVRGRAEFAAQHTLGSRYLPPDRVATPEERAAAIERMREYWNAMNAAGQARQGQP